MRNPAEDSGSIGLNRRLAALERLIQVGGSLVAVAAIVLLFERPRALDVVVWIGSAAMLIGAFGLVQTVKRLQSELTALSTRLDAVEHRLSTPEAFASPVEAAAIEANTGALATAPAIDVDSLRAQLDAARAANDPERVLELRAEIMPLISKSEALARDKSLVSWFMALLMRRMRAGSVRADVALLAEKVSTAFAETVEGASLRASLPTLRRSAGLCPRCAQPYVGIEDACGECLVSALRAPIELDDSGTTEARDDDGVFDLHHANPDGAAL